MLWANRHTSDNISEFPACDTEPEIFVLFCKTDWNQISKLHIWTRIRENTEEIIEHK